MTYKELITHLQILEPVPSLVAVYPEKQGNYRGSDYYCVADSSDKLNVLLSYLSIMNDWKMLIFEERKNPELIHLSNEICKNAYTKESKIRKIHSWVFNNIEYFRTPYLVPPSRLIDTKRGDCKSFTVLISTLLGIQGIPSWFKLVIAGSDVPNHIYSYAKTSWYPVDGTGYFPFDEISGIQGYLLFEVDDTPDFPPRPVPQGAPDVAPPPIDITVGVEGAEYMLPLAILLCILLLKRRSK